MEKEGRGKKFELSPFIIIICDLSEEVVWAAKGLNRTCLDEESHHTWQATLIVSAIKFFSSPCLGK